MRTAVLILLAASLPLAAQTPVEQRTALHDERGFVAEKAYQFDGLDSVSLFNGNLTLTVPLGGSYPVSSNLAYGLKLYYNSKVWELIEGGQNACVSGQPDGLAAFPARAAHARASAGLGWTFSLGQLITQTQDSLNNRDSYISPDGARHSFSGRQTLTGVPGYTAVAYSADSEQLRLRVTTAGQYEVEFPDGATHTFGSDGLLLRMADRFDNAVQVSMAEVNGTWIWTLQDAHRLQTVRFKDAWTELDAGNRFESLRWIAESIDLASFSADGSSQPVGRYEFDYSYESIARGCGAATPYAPCSGVPEVPLLETIRWVPDGSTFTFEYNKTAGAQCQQGTLAKVTLPTGGAIGWTYAQNSLPVDGCGWNPFAATDGMNRTVGVSTKTLYDTDGNQVGAWTYDLELGPLTTTSGMCADIDPPGGGQPVPVDHRGYQYLTNTVTDPLGRATVHYFATWTDDVVSTSGNWERDYGLPFTHTVTATGAPGPRYLSQTICAAGASPCNVLRSVYLAYDDTAPELAPRMRAEHTVFNDDPENPPGPALKHYLDSASSNYDGLGHYRQSTASSSFGATRTSFRDVNGEAGIGVIAADDPWLTGLYTKDETTEGSATAASRVCFDSENGALLGKRTLLGTSLHENDVAVRYGYDDGNVVSEDFYGGDETTLQSNDLCDLPSGTETSQYRLDHTYTAGVRESSQYRDTTFKSFDVTVDARSGLARTSRDAAGAGAAYTYDKLGRIEVVRPANEAWSHYQYETTSRPATVVVRRFGPAASDPNTATPINERRLYYDGLGRLIQTRDQMPAGWSVVNHTYDAIGQRTRTSMPELRTGGAYEAPTAFTPAHATELTFDRFGRVATTTTPDGKVSVVSYVGARIVERMADVGGAAVTTRETYDGHGRLTGVTENASSNVNAVTTSYGYDVGNRLHSVVTTKGGITQERTFLYDHRGFLIYERHPEKGPNGNGGILYGAFEGLTFVPAFDARGHALRRIDGVAGGSHDLKLTYDDAERLVKVEDLDPNGNRRTMKVFDYAGANVPAGCVPGTSSCDAKKGKLSFATRYNNAPDLGEVSVTETYEYKGLGGRPTRRVTSVGETSYFAGASFTLDQQWDDHGFLSSVTYPFTAAVPQTRTVTFGYTRGLLTSVAGYATITYQASGLVDTVTHGAGGTAVTEKWIADPQKMARPLRIEVTGPNALSWSYGDYAYDGAGNITAIGPNSYTYDAMNRLTGWTTAQASGASSTTGRVLDLFGNYLGSTFRGCGPVPANGPRSCYTTTYVPMGIDPETNHYTSATYDHAGSVTSDGVYAYGYDASAMMTSLTGSGRNERYLYTADDERIAIVDRALSKTTFTLRGTDNRLLRTFTRASVSSNTGWSWVEDEIWRGSQLLASESSEGRKRYHLDHLGSPRLITDAQGNLLGEQQFLPFGQGGTTDGGRLQFTGHERDVPSVPTAGGVLDYMHARYYSPGLGRFLSVDPALDLKKTLPTPQMWNRYAYVINNPLRYTDPTGREADPGELDGVDAQATALSIGRFLKSALHIDSLREAFSGFGSAPANEKAMAIAIGVIAVADIGGNTIQPGKAAVQKGAGAIVIGHFPGNKTAAAKIGAEILNISNWTFGRNRGWLRDALRAGKDIFLSTDPTKVRVDSILEKELKYLAKRGWAFVKDADSGLWKAVRTAQ